jgi:hypothetical protein
VVATVLKGRKQNGTALAELVRKLADCEINAEPLVIPADKMRRRKRSAGDRLGRVAATPASMNCTKIVGLCTLEVQATILSCWPIAPLVARAS